MPKAENEIAPQATNNQTCFCAHSGNLTEAQRAKEKAVDLELIVC